MIKKLKALYIDDMRTPINNPPEGYKPWHIVRNYVYSMCRIRN